MKFEQRPYQIAATDGVCDAFFTNGYNRLLVKSPTGTGKTVWFAGLIEDPRILAWIAQMVKRGANVLVIAHREELLDQAAEKISAQNRGMMVSIEQGDRRASVFGDVIVASIQTLAAQNFARLKRIISRTTPRIVIVDEAHHSAAATYRTALALLGFLPTAVSSETGNVEAASFDDVALMKRALEGWDAKSPKDRILVGVTATPNRTDAIGLACVYQTIAYSYGLQQAIADGWLVPIKPWVIETAENLDEVHTRAGDFVQKELAAAVNVERRNRLALESWLLYARERPTIAFCASVQHAEDFAHLWERSGVRVATVNDKTPKDTRRAIVRDARAGRIQGLTNFGIFTEGTDIPVISCILHLRPTKSATLYEQMTGRGLRPVPGDPVGPSRIEAVGRGYQFLKQDCIVLDVVDIARKHSLQSAPVLYGLPPSIKTKGDELQKTADDIDGLREKFPTFDIEAILASGRMSIQELLDRASTFDVWQLPGLGAIAELVSLQWIKIAADHYRVQYPWGDGHEVLEVVPDLLGHYAVSCTMRPQNGHVRQRTLAEEIPTVLEALQHAEAFVQAERRSAARLRDKNAAWRLAPASPRQIQLLERYGVPFDVEKLAKKGGKGIASDMLDLAMASKAHSVRR